MNAPRQLIIREVQLAFMLGFMDVEPFRRAVKAGDVPAPSEYVGGKPVWYLQTLEHRYGMGFLDSDASSERDVLDAIDAM